MENKNSDNVPEFAARLIALIIVAILTVIAVILAIALFLLFLAITGNLATFAPWDQFLPSKDMDLIAVFYHYLNLVLAGFIYWFEIIFIGAFIFVNSRHSYRNIIFILGFGILICLLIRSFFM